MRTRPPALLELLFDGMQGRRFAFAARCAVRLWRWCELSLGLREGQRIPPLIESAYWAGVRDAIEALHLSERERLILAYKHGQQSERDDAVLAHEIMRDALRRARKDLDKASEQGLGDRARLTRLRAELAYLRGEGRPDALDLAGPGRRPVPPASQSTEQDDERDRDDCNSGPEWYADDDERRFIGRSKPIDQLRPPDDEAGEE